MKTLACGFSLQSLGFVGGRPAGRRIVGGAQLQQRLQQCASDTSLGITMEARTNQSPSASSAVDIMHAVVIFMERRWRRTSKNRPLGTLDHPSKLTIGHMPTPMNFIESSIEKMSPHGAAVSL